MAYKDKDTFFSEYFEKKKTENSFANPSSSGTKKTRDQFFLDYLKGKKESANTPDNRTPEERLSSALAEVHGREIPKGQSLASRLTNPSVRNATEEYLDELKEKQSRLEEFIQSEKEEGERRAAINQKRKDAREAGELDGDKERESVLGYIGERVKLATDLLNESAEAFSRGEQESWAQTLKESANEFTNFFKNPSEMLDSSYKKSIAGEAKEEKDSVRYAPYEEMAQRGTSAKRMQEIEQNYPTLSKNAVVKGVGDVAASVTNMVPAIIAGATPVVGPVLSAGIMAATSAPGAYEEARLDGATQEQAIKYSNVEAINQGIGDMLFGGIAGTGKGILDAGLDVLTRGASSRFAKRALGKLARSPLGKTAVKYLSSSAGEGVEEMAQSLISTANKRATYDPNAKVNWDDVKYEGIIGSLMGGVFGLTQLPTNYMAYRSDADLVKTYAQSAAHITNAEEAKLVVSLGDEIVRQVDEAVKASDGNEELAERAQFIRDAVSSARDEVEANGEAIAETNANISDTIEAIAESPSEAIVEGSARLVETVAENIEPGEDAVKATIDIVRDKIQEQAELAAEAKTSEEKLAAQVDGAVLREIDSTLRNNKEEVETARGELPENNLTSPAESGTINTETVESGETKTENALTLVYGTHKHTKTGENMHVLKKSANLSDEDFAKIKEEIKKIGGYYSTYLKGFVIPDGSSSGLVGDGKKPKVSDVIDALAKIGVSVSGYNSDVAGDATSAAETPADTATSPKSSAKITYPEGITATDKTKFTRLFKKWMENEHVNISDMTSDDARKFASFASKLYQAGYNGTRKVGNFAGLTDEELTGFPVFLQDEFYNLGFEAGKKTGFMAKNKEASTADDAKASPARTAAGDDVNALSDNQTQAPVSGFSGNMQSFSDSVNDESRRETSEIDKTNPSVAAFPKTSISQNQSNVNTPESQIADYVVDRLEKGLKIKTEDIQKAANEAYGGTQAEGTYDVKSMTDAMELGVNRYLLDTIRENESEFNSDKATDAVDSIREINEDILAKIPTQTKRSDEQISLQQFSTPPNIAYTAAWVANIADSDSVLEPSAGIGGLATFAKAFGAETIVNELSERRLEVLKNLPFDGFYNENAEHIDNILPDNVKPTVVLMNPPFSSTGGRTKNSTKNAIPHIEQALLRLEDGGRLVAILGKGMANDAATFKGWWDELRKSYNIRANIGINGENYRKYGTTFDVQLVVIDKTGPQTSETITGYYDNLEEIPALLEGVRNDRTRTETADRGNESQTALKGGRKTGNEVVSGRSQSDTDSGSDGVSGRRDSARNGDLEVSDADRSGGYGEPGTGKSVQSEGDVQISDDGGRGGRLAGRSDSGTGEERGSGRVDSRNGGAGASGQSGSLVPSESRKSVTDLVKKKATEKKAAENDDGVYAEYKTVSLTVKNAKKHPAKLVESSAMSAVSSPDLTYTPRLDKKLIESGALSDAQLENISYAGQAHEQILPNKQRKGYFIGDGTGVGKGRQLAGIIMDNWNQGRHKAIWISENKNLSEDARRDWKDLGGDPEQIIDWEKAQKKGIPSDGILFIPYSSLAGGKTKKRETTVLETLENWFGKDFDGVIVFDEAHNMGNLIPMKGARGTKKPSQKAVAGNNLQTELPNARITYASATGATNIENLSYAARLGLWGDGTSFRDVQDFVSKIGRSGIAAMELVARDMKSMGVYLARSISYDGVVYDSLQHKLTADQRKMYDGMSEGWQIVLQNFDKAMKITGSENAKDVKQHRGQVYGNMQQFYNQVLTSMTMPTVIKDIEKQLASGKSCVIQLVNTNEAAQDRAVSDAKAEGKTDLDDLDITPRQLLVGYVENAFPINQYEEYLDENGNKATRMVLDSSGKPVVNKQAVKIRDELIGRLNEISIPEGPLDMLLNHFGADQVAEITGRSGRVLTVKDENGNEHKQYISRDSGKSNIAETKDFQDGNKRILVFSGAGSTGRSFHADKRAKNQQNRIHYVLQPGWKAETAVQGFGRTHRSNQVSAPVFRLVSTDVMGHKRFVTSIARRLDQLGALTKGQRQTGSGVFGEKDNLESPLSAQALREFYRRLGINRLPGLDAKSVFGKMGLDKAFYDEFDRFTLNENIASDIPKFLNRLLALPVEEQNAVFNAFEDIRDSFYQAAIETGTLDMGLENVKADKIEIMQDDVVYTDPATGAETRYVKAKLFTKPRVIQTVEDAQGYRDGFKGLYRMQDGSVRAAYRLADKTDEFGRVKKYYALISPNVAVQSRYEEATMTIKTEAVPKDQWESSWEDEVKNVPEFNESERHMITGALLPIWNRLPETDNVKAQRIVASDGTQYLGRMINSDAIDMTLRQLDVNVQKTQYTGKQIYDEIMNRGKRVTMRGLYGGTLTFERRRVSGENRLEVSGAGAYSLVDKYPGMIPETINFQKRYFIPTGKLGEEILEKAMKDLGGVRSIDSDDGGAYYSLGSSRGKWGKGDAKAEVPSVTELTRQASRIFGIEINTGKIGEAGASGIFKTHAGTIRTRQFGDIPTIAHELGHWFDKKYKLVESPHVKTLVEAYKDSLVNAGYSPSLFRYEAVAEYFSEFMRNQGATEKKFPKFTGWLYDTISEADQKRLLEYSGLTNAYFAADAERRADAQIHSRVKDQSFYAKAQLQLDVLLRNPRSYLGTLSRRFTRRFVDDLADLKSFGKSYDLAYLEKTADSVVSGRLFTAMTDKNGNVLGPSLRDILSNGNINDVNRLEFDKYLIACVALDRINASEKAKPEQKIGFLVYGDETLQNKDSIVERIEEYERKNGTFRDTAKALYQYNRNLLRIAVDSGLVSESLYDKLNEMYPHYVPLYRVMDDNNQSGGKIKSGYANQNAPVGRFKGSGRDIYSPIENIMQNVEKFTKACMRNDVMREFADYIDNNEDLGWAGEKVPEAKIFDVISTDGIARRLADFKSDKLGSMTEEQMNELLGEVMDFIGDYAGMWKPNSKQGRNVVSVMRNGSREYYEIHDSDLMKTLVALDARVSHPIIMALGKATKVFKVLTTGSNPLFGITNVARDLQSGFVSSETTNSPLVYVKDYCKAWWGAITQSEEYREYVLNGGGWMGSLTMDYKQLKSSEKKLLRKKWAHSGFVDKTKTVMSVVSESIPRLVDAGESASRYAEFKRAREQGIETLEAIRKAQEVTVNFQRGGTLVKEIDDVIPYFRASINSMYHLFDVLAKGDKQQLQARWSKFVALNTIPAVIGILWREVAPLLCQEDEEEVNAAYDTLSTYNKNAYWCMYVGNGRFARVAKPKDMTVFSTVWERLVEYSFYNDKSALYGLVEYILDSISPPTARDATIIGTVLSLAENKTFTGAPIVPTAYQNLDRRLQYKGDTSLVAYSLGSALNLSPMQIDFVLEDTTGYVGTLITNLARVDGKTNLGFLNKWVVDSVYSTDNANIFYNQKELFERNAGSYKHTGGMDSRYTITDVYGKYKYAKIADTYSSLNKFMKSEKNDDISRSMKDDMNGFLAAVNDMPINDLDKAVIDIAETTGVAVSDIAPYVVVPDEVTYSKNKFKEKYSLTFDEMMEYYIESQAALAVRYRDILASGYSDDMMAAAMKEAKEEIATQMRDRWEEIKFHEKYR